METMTLVIPIMGQLHDIKGILGQLLSVTSLETEILFIDNGVKENAKFFIEKYLRPIQKYRYIKNEGNIGCFKTIQQGWKECQTDIIMFTHSDIMIYEINYDVFIRHLFESIDNLGLVGLFGVQGTDHNGSRISSWSNMLEAEIHGARLTKEYQAISHVDGLFMACSKKMLDACGGIDQDYLYHHYEDRELSMNSLAHEFKNVVANISCHHWNGITANRAEYQEWINEKLGLCNADKHCHDFNMNRFNEKWGIHLPLYIDDDFSFRGRPYKDTITK